MIDVQDCDARLPSSGDPNDLYMGELVRLSVILGRVLKTIYRYDCGCRIVSPDLMVFKSFRFNVYDGRNVVQLVSRSGELESQSPRKSQVSGTRYISKRRYDTRRNRRISLNWLIGNQVFCIYSIRVCA